MKEILKSLRILLLLLVIGVWGILLTLLIKLPGQTQSSESPKKLSVITIRKSDGEMVLDEGEELGLTATGLMNAINKANQKGWQINSILTPQAGGYIVVVER